MTDHADVIRQAAANWVNAAVFEAVVREGITGHIDEVRNAFERALAVAFEDSRGKEIQR